MFKALIGKGHPEFSTNRQQDAQEFFLHLINMVEVRTGKMGRSSLSSCLPALQFTPFFPLLTCSSSSVSPSPAPPQ